MRVRQRAAVAGAVLVTAPLFVGNVLLPPAAAVMQVAAKPDKKQEKQEKKQDGKQDRRGDDRRRSGGPDRPKPDRTPPATPALGAPGVGAGGAVSLPVSAESGSYIVVVEVGGPVVATGTGTGGYTSLGWTTSHGSHSYVVSATDRAGNRSGSAQTSVVADAVPPRLGGVRLREGNPADTRTRVVFSTDAGSRYRILVGGRQLALGRASGDVPLERLVDLPDGRHRVEVVVSDVIGNSRSVRRPVTVRIPELAVTTRVRTDGSDRTQAVRVRATPTATRGVVRIPGRAPVPFVMRRGWSTSRFDLPDGTYRPGTVVVRDTQGRTGRGRLPGLVVDTSAPTLDVVPDKALAAEGSVGAAVTAEDGVDVRWRVLDPEGDAVSSGEVVLQDGKGTVAADVEEGTYRLVVAATDAFDRTTVVRTRAVVAEDPWPTWVVVLLRTLLVAGAVLALAALVLAVRWAGRPDGPVRPALAAARRAAEGRLRPLVGSVPGGAAAGAGVALFEPEAPRLPSQRLPGRAGGVLPPEDEVLHRTPVRLYETTEEHDDGPVLGSRSAELVLAREHIALVDDRTGDVWSGRVAVLAHLRPDTTMVLPAGEDRWIGIVYADQELTRPALDVVAAEQSERRLTSAGAPGDQR